MATQLPSFPTTFNAAQLPALPQFSLAVPSGLSLPALPAFLPPQANVGMPELPSLPQRVQPMSFPAVPVQLVPQSAVETNIVAMGPAVSAGVVQTVQDLGITKMKELAKELKIGSLSKYSANNKIELANLILNTPSFSTLSETDKNMMLARYAGGRKSSTRTPPMVTMAVTGQPVAAAAVVVVNQDLKARLDQQTITNLKELAKEAKIPGYSSYKKDTADLLVQKILEVYPADKLEARLSEFKGTRRGAKSPSAPAVAVVVPAAAPSGANRYLLPVDYVPSGRSDSVEDDYSDSEEEFDTSPMSTYVPRRLTEESLTEIWVVVSEPGDNLVKLKFNTDKLPTPVDFYELGNVLQRINFDKFSYDGDTQVVTLRPH